MVPAGWRCQVFDAIHSLSHPGVKASVKLVGAKFVWPGLQRDIRGWAAICMACQRAKVHWHSKAPLEPFHIPGRRFDHFNVDLMGPIPPLPWIYSSPFHGGQDHQVARGCASDIHHIRGGGLGVYLCFGGPVWHTF